MFKPLKSPFFGRGGKPLDPSSSRFQEPVPVSSKYTSQQRAPRPREPQRLQIQVFFSGAMCGARVQRGAEGRKEPKRGAARGASGAEREAAGAAPSPAGGGGGGGAARAAGRSRRRGSRRAARARARGRGRRAGPEGGGGGRRAAARGSAPTLSAPSRPAGRGAGGVAPGAPAAGSGPARPRAAPGPGLEAPRLLRTRKKQPARGDRSGRKRQ